MVSLAERLGYADDAKLVIVSCDDLGSCHAANAGVLQALHEGVATCASLMVPAPWARHAAGLCTADDDIGVHLTLNAEHAAYRWGPITHAPSLLSGEGGFPRNLTDLWEHADPAEVRRTTSLPLATPCDLRCRNDGPRRGELCGGTDAECNSAPGARDGVCDACTLRGGVTTEDEMFILFGSYYCVEGSSCYLPPP